MNSLYLQSKNLTMKIFSILLILIFPLALVAQKNSDDDEEEEKLSTKTLAYGITSSNHTGIIGGLILRNSFPVSIRNGKPVNRYLAIEALNLKNSREKNSLSTYGSKFIFGKTNYLFSLRTQYGREYYFFKNDKDNGVGFSLIVAGGPSFGLIKPYYIKYAGKSNESPQTVPFDPNIHKNVSNITGAANIWEGFFTNLKLNPGLHFKVAGNFDLKTFNDNMTGMEVGTTFEVFSKKAEILSSKFSDNPRAFASVYLTLYFGNKKLLKKKKNDNSGK